MLERDRASEVVASIATTDAFGTATQIWQKLFAEKPIPIVQQIQSNWQADDTATIRKMLSGWFG